MVLEQQVDAEVEAPEVETADTDEQEEEVSAEPSVDELLGKPEVAERIQQQIDKAVDAATSRVRTQTLVENRRRFADAELITNTLNDISREISEKGEVTDSIRDRAKNLVATHGQAVQDTLAEQVTNHFFAGPYELDADVQLQATRMIQDGKTDEAISSLIEAAVVKRNADAESKFEQRVKSEVEKRVKAELASSNGNSGSPPPTPRGGGARTGPSLTSAELMSTDRRVQDAIRALSKEQRDKLYDRVAAADERRGADVLRDSDTILADLEGLAS